MGTSEVTIDVERLPLDRLRRLADDARDPATKAAAQRALKSRTAPAAAIQRAAQVVVASSAYGTAQPELQLQWSDASEARLMRATLHELAAQAERMLARTPEMWLVDVRVDSDTSGAVCVELMLGEEAEAARACALLRAIAPAADGRKRRGRKPKGVATPGTARAPGGRQNGKPKDSSLVA